MSTITIRVTPKEKETFKKYANLHDMNLSEFIKKRITESLEDEFDYQRAIESLEEYNESNQGFTFEEMRKKHGV